MIGFWVRYEGIGEFIGEGLFGVGVWVENEGMGEFNGVGFLM